MFINKIKIKNIKGKKEWEHSFDGLCSNKVNLFVAYNGYGKTTLTTAFASAAHGKIDLNKKDYYNDDQSNEPSLELEYSHEGETKTVITDTSRGEVSNSFTIFSISSPIYAKSTSRNMGNFSSRSAELYIQNIEVCKIPNKCELSYSFNNFSKRFNRNAPNLKKFISSCTGLELIMSSKEEFNKCVKQKSIQDILKNISLDNIASKARELQNHPIASKLMEKLASEYNLNYNEGVQYFFQIIEIIKENKFKNIQKTLAWLKYKKLESMINRRLKEFNTTGHTLSSKKHGNKLIVSFGRADKMSNGERDVLSFVISLLAFETSINKKPSILLIDEVFDYLDGTNLLAAHYYLSQMIANIKKKNKNVFPIIMTHLDPVVFSNYCFKGMAVHYLTNKSNIDLNDRIVKLLVLRGILKESNDNDANNLEKYLLHYYPQKWTIPDSIIKRLPTNFWQDSHSFKSYLYTEIKDKYLRNIDYNALAVIIGLRIKVEENTVKLLPEDKREEYYQKYGSKNKLLFADDCNIDVPELFYLLQPLYNDSAHLRNSGKGHEKENRNKIESAYLKLSSQIVKEMISEVFRE